MSKTFTADDRDTTVAAALHLAGVCDKSQVKPLAIKARQFTRGNNGPSEKHGMSLKRYFDLKDGKLDSRFYV